VELIQGDPESIWFDDPDTPGKETLQLHVQKSFRSSIADLQEWFGEDQDQWKWGYVNRTDLNHLAAIPGLGKQRVFTDGSGESINAIRGSHGPSWRMIVELDPEGVRGYGVYPGGQSGNPGSKTYDAFVETWRTGELYELEFLREEPQNSQQSGPSSNEWQPSWVLTLQ